MNSAHVADALELASSTEYTSERVHRGSGASQRMSTQIALASATSAATIATISADVERWLEPARARRAVVSGAPAGVSVRGAVAPAGVVVAGVVVTGVDGLIVLGVVVAAPGLGVGDALGVGKALAGVVAVVVAVAVFDAFAVALPRRSEAGIGKLGGLLAARAGEEGMSGGAVNAKAAIIATTVLGRRSPLAIGPITRPC